MNSDALRILFATPECAPWVKTGGLGDISAGLPAALLGAGLDVRVLLPAYPQVLEHATPRQPLADIAAERFPAVRLWEAALPSGVTALLLDCAQMFDRPGGPYTDADGNAWDDNALRYSPALTPHFPGDRRYFTATTGKPALLLRICTMGRAPRRRR